MYRFLKRTLSFLISLIAILIFSPFYILLPILISIFLGTPVLFKQKRVGRNNRIFTLYKFRSMNNKKDEFGNFLPDEQRLTTFGKILRKSSLDELPQLFNILIGDMAIVGPRPKTVEESYFISNTNYICRHSVRPGITGLAIIKGRNELDPDKAFRIDLEYVSNMNLWLDMKIFIKTFLVVIFRKGITSKNRVTFLPHHEYWQEQGVYTHSQIVEMQEAAKKLVMSNARYLETTIDIQDGRKKLIEKYRFSKKHKNKEAVKQN